MITQVKNLKLSYFRNYEYFELSNLGKIIILLGNNGAGKTNLLESISLLAKGRGIRNASIEAMQNSNNCIPWSIHYKLNINQDEIHVGMAKKMSNQRTLLIDNKFQNNYNLLNKIINVIWLIPEIDHIFLKSLSERLKFFDRIVSIFQKDFISHLLKYNKIKHERSQLLKNNSFDLNWLSSLENVLAINGIKISIARMKSLEIIKKIIIDSPIIQSFPKISIILESQISQLINNISSEEAIDKYCQQLKNSRKNDMLTNRLNFGIHNDKLRITNLDKKVEIDFCSTGEQKIILVLIILSAVLGKKLIDNSHPILLLDDIMSHLDEKYRNILLDAISEINCQTWITDVNEIYFKNNTKKFHFFRIGTQ